MTRRDRSLILVALMALAVLICGLTACANKTVQSDTITCDDCGVQIAKKDARIVGNRLVCANCAAKIEAQTEAPAMAPTVPDSLAQGAIMRTCAVCGMRMATRDMVEVDGKWYCPHCAPARAHPQERPADPQGEAGHEN